MKSIYFIMLTCLLFVGCKNNSTQKLENPETESHLEDHVELGLDQVAQLSLEIGPLTQQNFNTYIEVNGSLKVPPQNEAVVTGILPGNLTQITVNEGDLVKQNQVLGYLSHPDLISLQTDYLKASTELNYLKREFERQQMLYKEGVAAGRVFQNAEKDYRNAVEMQSGLAAQLRLLQLDPQQIQLGRIAEKIPIKSPISGYIQRINVKTGQFIEPQKTPLFEIIDPDNIYAELRVYEKELKNLKIGQAVELQVNEDRGEIISAELISIGQSLDATEKVAYVRAKIKEIPSTVLPGTFVRAKIKSEGKMHWVLAESAFVNRDGKTYVFMAEQMENEWVFYPLEVQPEFTSNDNTAFQFVEGAPHSETLLVHQNAYYILAEAQKGEGEHAH